MPWLNLLQDMAAQQANVCSENPDTQSIEGCVWVPDQKEKNEWYIKSSFVDFKLATTRKLYTSYSFARDNMFRFTIDDLALPNEADKFTVLTALETCRAERKQMDDQKTEYDNQIDQMIGRKLQHIIETVT